MVDKEAWDLVKPHVRRQRRKKLVTPTIDVGANEVDIDDLHDIASGISYGTKKVIDNFEALCARDDTSHETLSRAADHLLLTGMAVTMGMKLLQVVESTLPSERKNQKKSGL